MLARRARTSRRDPDRGASAVEFALIMPVLFLLIFGIIDYGLLFFDSIGLRQGAREGARQAVVQRYDSACSTGSVGARIACTTKRATDNTLGSPVVYIPTPTGAASPPWSQGNQLLVCMQVKEQSITGFVPYPANGILRTKTYMSVEVGTPAVDPSYTADAAPSGSDWSWCN
jgi:Flp pilus assembly protein TadG